MRLPLILATATLGLIGTAAAQADDLKIGLIYGKTGPLEIGIGLLNLGAATSTNFMADRFRCGRSPGKARGSGRRSCRAGPSRRDAH